VLLAGTGSSEIRGWVHEGDLPPDKRKAMYERIDAEYRSGVDMVLDAVRPIWTKTTQSEDWLWAPNREAIKVPKLLEIPHQLVYQHSMLEYAIGPWCFGYDFIRADNWNYVCTRSDGSEYWAYAGRPNDVFMKDPELLRDWQSGRDRDVRGTRHPPAHLFAHSGR
jgi:hypothetical protein